MTTLVLAIGIGLLIGGVIFFGWFLLLVTKAYERQRQDDLVVRYFVTRWRLCRQPTWPGARAERDGLWAAMTPETRRRAAIMWDQYQGGSS